MLREFAPLITAIIIAGRSGSAYAMQIGTMVVTEEYRETKVNYAVVGAFVLVLGAVLIAGVLWLASGGAFQKKYAGWRAVRWPGALSAAELAPAAPCSSWSGLSRRVASPRCEAEPTCAHPHLDAIADRRAGLPTCR